MLLKHGIEGFKGDTGFMPPRGGCSDCTDEDLKNAIDFITSKAQ